MIQEITLRKLIPDREGDWLYKEESGVRAYAKRVYLGKEADPAEWQECSDAEKVAWEEAHKPAESEEEG